MSDRLEEVIAEEWPSFLDRSFIFARNRFRNAGLVVGVADEGRFFTIGDAPVITFGDKHDGLGPHQRMALGEARTVVMPLTPRLLVSMESGGYSVQKLNSQAVTRVNDLQERRYVHQYGAVVGSAEAQKLMNQADKRGIIRRVPPNSP